jgi:hypothetical protein
VERAGDDVIDASFNIYPDMGSAYERHVRFALVDEDNGWRVNDMLYGQGRSMRQELQRENAAVLARARELADAAGWVFNYLGNEDMLDRAMRFIAFPVQVCDPVRRVHRHEARRHAPAAGLDVLADNGADSITCPSRAR